MGIGMVEEQGQEDSQGGEWLFAVTLAILMWDL